MSNDEKALAAEERRGKTRAQAHGFVAALLLCGLMAGPVIDKLQREMIAVAVAPLSTWSLSLDGTAETDMAGRSLRLNDGA